MVTSMGSSGENGEQRPRPVPTPAEVFPPHRKRPPTRPPAPPRKEPRDEQGESREPGNAGREQGGQRGESTGEGGSGDTAAQPGR